MRSDDSNTTKTVLDVRKERGGGRCGEKKKRRWGDHHSAVPRLLLTSGYRSNKKQIGLCLSVSSIIQVSSWTLCYRPRVRTHLPLLVEIGTLRVLQQKRVRRICKRHRLFQTHPVAMTEPSCYREPPCSHPRMHTLTLRESPGFI